MKFPNSRRDGILDCHFEVRSHLRIEFKIERLFVRMGAPLFFSTIANRLVDSLIETRCQSFSSSECVVGDPQTILKMHSPRAGSIARGRWRTQAGGKRRTSVAGPWHSTPGRSNAFRHLLQMQYRTKSLGTDISLGPVNTIRASSAASENRVRRGGVRSPWRDHAQG